MPFMYLIGHHFRKPRPVLVQPDNPLIRLIALTQNLVAEVDAWNYDKLMEMAWYAWKDPDDEKYYAKTNLKNRASILMHDFILHPPSGYVVDHIDRNSLRNVESNLRLATNAQNCHNHKRYSTNKSGHTGVYWYLGKWRAYITFNSKSIYIGSYCSLSDAVAARHTKETELFGKYARLCRDDEASQPLIVAATQNAPIISRAIDEIPNDRVAAYLPVE